MAMREVDETEFLNSQTVIRTVNAMMSDPKARKLVQQAQKIVNPNVVIPELDAAAPVLEEVTALRAENASILARMNAEKEERENRERVATFTASWESKKSALRQRGYTEEGITAIEALAEERGLADLEAASALFDRLHPPAEIADPTSFNSFNMFENGATNEDFKKLLEAQGDDSAAERNMINAALSEVRGQRR